MNQPNLNSFWKSFFAISLLFIAFGLCAKEKSKESVGILRFQAASGIPDDIRVQVEQHVNEQFVAERRFDILERTKLDALEAERFLQEAMDPAQQQKLNELGARWIVVGDVSQANVSQRIMDSGVVYEAVLTYGLKILDVKTGRVAYAEQFSNSSGNVFQALTTVFQDKSSPAAALRSGLLSTDKKLAAFLDKAFPVLAKVISIERQGRRGQAEEILIAKGPADGITPKTKLIAFQRTKLDVGGEMLTRERELGELVVLRSEGDHISICKVTKGGDLIAARIASGKIVYVKVK